MIRLTAFCALFVTQDALAWELGNPFAGSTVDLQMGNSLSSTRQIRVSEAALAWRAGSGEILRGASWSGIASPTGPTGETVLNGVDEAYMKNDAWFTSAGMGGALGFVFNAYSPGVTPPPGSGGLDVDMVFNSSKSWCNNALASNPGCRGTQNPAGMPVAYSFGQVAVHLFGHVVGLDDENDLIATMNEVYPHGGGVGQYKWSIHEDDYTGLSSIWPGSSTGFNVSVGEWRHSPSAQARIMWEEDPNVTPGLDLTYDKSAMSWTDTPKDPRFVYTGTGSRSVRVEWRVSSNSTCTTADPLVGSRQPSMSANTPYVVGPVSWDFSAVAVGDYYLCVMVDPFDVLNDETLEADNIVRSRKADITVVP